MKYFLITCIYFFVAHNAASQYVFLGHAQPMEGGCILLTEDSPYSEGIAWSMEKVNLNGFFEIQFDLYFGKNDESGADGICFVIHNDDRQFEAFGTYGEALGYGRWRRNALYGNYISPSIAIEFDTYQNFTQNDPSFDHVAYLENGTNYHESFWHNDDENFNLEDDRLHDFRFRWEPEIKRISVFLDGNLVHQSVRDLVQDIFNGDPSVIWGFTASTGRKHNLQYFCLKRMVFHPSEMDNTKIAEK